MDVLLRIAILGHEWYCNRREGFMFLNVFDACVVAVNAFELLILPLRLRKNHAKQSNNDGKRWFRRDSRAGLHTCRGWSWVAIPTR